MTYVIIHALAPIFVIMLMRGEINLFYPAR